MPAMRHPRLLPNAAAAHRPLARRPPASADARAPFRPASITATAVLPAAAAVAGTAAAPAPLTALAQGAQQQLVCAAAAMVQLVGGGGGGKPAAKAAVSVPAAAPAQQQQAPAVALSAAAPAVAATRQQQQQARALRQFVAGGLAGAVAKTLVAPMERLSTMMMADSRRFGSVAEAARHAWRDGMYRGHAATLVKIFPASAVQFAVFNGLKDRILAAKQAARVRRLAAQQRRQQQQQRVAAAPAAAAAGAAASPAAAPAQQQQQLAVALPPVELQNHERLLAGAAAGACSASLCYPLECIRTMMGGECALEGGQPGAGGGRQRAAAPVCAAPAWRAELSRRPTTWLYHPAPIPLR